MPRSQRAATRHSCALFLLAFLTAACDLAGDPVVRTLAPDGARAVMHNVALEVDGIDYFLGIAMMTQTITVELFNEGGEGFVLLEYWGYAEAPGTEERRFHTSQEVRMKPDSGVVVQESVFTGHSLHGVEWVIAHSRAVESDSWIRTHRFDLPRGSEP